MLQWICSRPILHLKKFNLWCFFLQYCRLFSSNYVMWKLKCPWVTLIKYVCKFGVCVFFKKTLQMLCKSVPEWHNVCPPVNFSNIHRDSFAKKILSFFSSFWWAFNGEFSKAYKTNTIFAQWTSSNRNRIIVSKIVFWLIKHLSIIHILPITYVKEH